MPASVRLEISIGLMIIMINATFAEVWGELFRGLYIAKAVEIGHVMSVLAVSDPMRTGSARIIEVNDGRFTFPRSSEW